MRITSETSHAAILGSGFGRVGLPRSGRRGSVSLPHPPAQENADDLSLAVRKWAEIVRMFGVICDFYRKLDPEATVESAVEVLFHGKPASTLLKPASSVQLYFTWHADRGSAPVPVTEQVVYAYFLELSSRGAPASRAFCFRETVAFCLGFLGLDGAGAFLESRRVTGASHKCMATKEADVEAGALPVRALTLLEQGAAGSLENVLDADRVLCGFAAFWAHARARVGDARQVTDEPSLDVDATGRGYVEVKTARHKTAARGSKKKFPFVAVATGVSGAKWAEAWLTVRKASGLNAQTDDCLQLTPGASGWTRSRIKTTVFGEWLVRFLRRHCSDSVGPPARPGRSGRIPRVPAGPPTACGRRGLPAIYLDVQSMRTSRIVDETRVLDPVSDIPEEPGVLVGLRMPGCLWVFG